MLFVSALQCSVFSSSFHSIYHNMKKTFSYVERLLENTATTMDFASYNHSRELFDQGKYVESIHAVIDFFNPEFRLKYDNDLGTNANASQPKKKSFFASLFGSSKVEKNYGLGRRFTIPHGSIIVNIEITETELKVHAPFLSVPEDGRRVPLLRRVCELNLAQLDLVHLVLEGNELHFKFSCPLELAHPHKLQYMFRELCINGDKYDDEFVTKFGAKRLYTPIVSQFPEKEVKRVVEGIRDTCKETIDAIEEFEEERKFGIAWHCLAIGLFKISYFARPQGMLDNDLDDAIRNAWDDEEDTPVQVRDGKEFLQKLYEKSDEELTSYIYKVEIMCSTRRASDLGNLRSNLAEAYDAAVKAYSSDSMECCIRSLLMIYRVYFYNDLQSDVDSVFTHALKRSASLEFGAAAKVLISALRRVMEQMSDSRE